jgi:hypothetical protein
VRKAFVRGLCAALARYAWRAWNWLAQLTLPSGGASKLRQFSLHAIFVRLRIMNYDCALFVMTCYGVALSSSNWRLRRILGIWGCGLRPEISSRHSKLIG